MGEKKFGFVQQVSDNSKSKLKNAEVLALD
jgi:hypothetical protein